MSRIKRLTQNTIIFFVANFGSKILSLLIVPLYTYTLTTAEYGTADLVISTVSLILPLISVLVYDAVLRFAMEKKKNPEIVLLEGLRIYRWSCIGAIVLIPLIWLLPSIRNYALELYLLLTLQGVYYIFQQYSKAISKTIVFAISGILFTASLTFFTWLFLWKWKLRIHGYFYSYIMSYIISVVYLNVSLKAWKLFKVKTNDKHLRIQMLKYSFPMIFNTIIWWLISSSDRYVITYYLGSNANGIYAVAHKIPSLITMIGGIFTQAWQLSAIETSDDDDKGDFYGKIFEVYFIILIFAMSVILLFARPVLDKILSSEYEMAWKYLPFLLYASIFSMLAQFWTAFYVAQKNTLALSTTATVSGVVNIILDIALTKKYGINGAAFATMISALLMWMMRVIGGKKFSNIKIELKSTIITLSLLYIQIFLYFMEGRKGIIGQVIICMIIVLCNLRALKHVFLNKSRIVK